MVVNFQLGKIYKLVDNTTGKIYIGSTCRDTLEDRLRSHESDYRQFLKGKFHNLTSFKILENKNYEIVLIENFPCSTKNELFERERILINENDCVNKNRPGLKLDLGKKEYAKLFVEENKEYYKNLNKDRYLKNKEQYQMYKRNYYLKNKEVFAQKYVCQCGVENLIIHRNRHLKRKKHLLWEQKIKNLFRSHKRLIKIISELLIECEKLILG